MLIKPTHDIIIIGAGLFGCMISKFFKEKSMKVLLIDNEDKLAASKCAIGIFKESWTSHYKEQYKVSLSVLKHFDLIEDMDLVDMNVLLDEKSKKEPFQNMHRIKVENILNEKRVIGDVVKIEDDTVYCRGAHIYRASKAVIVAAGYRTPELLKQYPNVPELEKYWGAILEVNSPLEENRIYQWAPYRQAIALRVNDNTFLFGDGTKVKDFEKKTEEVERVSNRMIQHLQLVTQSSDLSRITATREGIRPILAKTEKNKFVRKHANKLFSATGGGKNSSMLCGFVASELFDLIEKN